MRELYVGTIVKKAAAKENLRSGNQTCDAKLDVAYVEPAKYCAVGDYHRKKQSDEYQLHSG